MKPKHRTTIRQPSGAFESYEKSDKIKNSNLYSDSRILTSTDELKIKALLGELWDENPKVYNALIESSTLDSARDAVFNYLENKERSLLSINNKFHPLDKASAFDAVRVLKSVFGPYYEVKTESSALEILWNMARIEELSFEGELKPGFILEFIHLFRSLRGETDIYKKDENAENKVPEFLKLKGREAANARMDILDDISNKVKSKFKKYPSGLEKVIIERRKENKEKILKYFNADEEDWLDYKWHLKHVIKSPGPLFDLIDLPEEYKEAIEKADIFQIPFGITPYYLSLMDFTEEGEYDHAIRAMVLPPANYVEMISKYRTEKDTVFDFMGERDTSPIGLVTRRYPFISILKPFNTCAQICVYCQRNWEIRGVLDPDALASRENIDNAIEWYKEHDAVGDVLITGGDPAVMKNGQLERLIEAVASNEHVYRIRIGTRTPVVLPMRWTEELIDILKKFHNPPKLEIAIVTHFEHSYEITPEALQAVQRIRKAGISVYNQQVYTIYNSRRFESVKLRRDLKSIGIDPYYTFNMKGKKETRKYMVPIARLLQERKEEARLLPGLDRTDEPVFNLPRLGKNHLRAGQDHKLVMIKPDGSRVYEFHPWEKNIAAIPPYYYNDVPIYNYLSELSKRGENIKEYKNIWYYY